MFFAGVLSGPATLSVFQIFQDFPTNSGEMIFKTQPSIGASLKDDATSSCEEEAICCLEGGV